MEGCNNSSGNGIIYITGTGPGSLDHITPAALKAIESSDVVIGYRTYLDLVSGLLEGREIISSEMMKEVERCGKCLDIAESGRKVALISGGDPGIYAMAGLVFEMASQRNSKSEIIVIPGISALNACASLLGAPLMHDFASVSLSDLLTPWSVIEKRLEAAVKADFVIVLYNPKSKKRNRHIEAARDIMLRHRSPSTPVGVVTGATRENEAVGLTSLEKMADVQMDMQSCVIIGNSSTFTWKSFMITLRGYNQKYSLSNHSG